MIDPDKLKELMKPEIKVINVVYQPVKVIEHIFVDLKYVQESVDKASSADRLLSIQAHPRRSTHG